MTLWTYGRRGRLAYGHAAVNARVTAFQELRSSNVVNPDFARQENSRHSQLRYVTSV
jgi:hypothetical protein